MLGTPTQSEVFDMNEKYDIKELSKFPKIKGQDWKNVHIFINIVTENKRSKIDRFDYKAALLFSNQ